MSERSRARAVVKEAHDTAPNWFLARWSNLLAGGVIVLAALAVYHNSFSGPFILDDQLAIADNPSIKHLGSALSLQGCATTGGRPLLNLTFALNFALGGLNVWGYHAFNLIVHTLTGLALFGIVRRTLLERPTSNIPHPTSKANQSPHQTRGVAFHGLSPADALLLALAVAVLWVVHPVQTEAVTYLSQRAESLMGLFYLLTLYGFVRGAENGRSGFKPDTSGINPDLRSKRGDLSGSQLSPLSSRLWFTTSILACLLGAMSKETIVTAPVMVLLYDRTFVAGSFREAWRLRLRYYLGLTCTWLLLARLMTSLGQRAVGFHNGVAWWSYALTSCRSVVLYLKLAVWPHPLVFDYGTHIIRHITEVLPDALVLVPLIAAVAVALWRRPVMGFAGAWVFVILAPTSSVVPVVFQPMAEHRLYLSLAAVVALGVIGLHQLIGRRGLMVCVAVAVGLGWLSVQRNKDYESELAIWSDTVAKSPDNARAHYNFGNALARLGRFTDALGEYKTAVQLKPDYVEAHNNLGNTLLQLGRLPEAIGQYELALRFKPDFTDARTNLEQVQKTMAQQAAGSKR